MKNDEATRSFSTGWTVFWHVLLSFSLIVGGRKGMESRKGRVVSENMSKSMPQISSGVMRVSGTNGKVENRKAKHQAFRFR
jgi:hypothetical protein